MTNQITTLWDFNHPEISEQRFLAELPDAGPDEGLILQTQIARTYGLRGDFLKAREILAGLEPQIQSASLEAQAYYFLELGRTYTSATHPAESQTEETRELARGAYLRACESAQKAGFDNLVIDALHMLAFVDVAEEDQLGWNRRALALIESSTQPEAKSWEGSLRNNTGYTLHVLGRYEEALQEFRLALAVNERGGNPQKIRIAHWMIAWTLRAMGQLNEALEIQLRLEKENDAACEPDLYVFEELDQLYRALNDPAKADFYASRRAAAS